MNEGQARVSFVPTHVAVICRDGPDSQVARKAAAPDHLRYVQTILERLALAGPLFSPDGQRMVGSLYVFKTGSLDEARQWLEADPYFAARFWQSIDYRPFLPAAGDFVGGTIW
jgi:uncharacterized protein YciI